jgi:hypothetical protein
MYIFYLPIACSLALALLLLLRCPLVNSYHTYQNNCSIDHIPSINIIYHHHHYLSPSINTYHHLSSSIIIINNKLMSLLASLYLELRPSFIASITPIHQLALLNRSAHCTYLAMGSSFISSFSHRLPPLHRSIRSLYTPRIRTSIHRSPLPFIDCRSFKQSAHCTHLALGPSFIAPLPSIGKRFFNQCVTDACFVIERSLNLR